MIELILCESPSNPQLVQYIYPDLYRVDELSDIGGIEDPADKEIVIPQPARLQVRRKQEYLLDVKFQLSNHDYLIS